MYSQSILVIELDGKESMEIYKAQQPVYNQYRCYGGVSRYQGWIYPVRLNKRASCI